MTVRQGQQRTHLAENGKHRPTRSRLPNKPWDISILTPIHAGRVGMAIHDPDLPWAGRGLGENQPSGGDLEASLEFTVDGNQILHRFGVEVDQGPQMFGSVAAGSEPQLAGCSACATSDGLLSWTSALGPYSMTWRCNSQRQDPGRPRSLLITSRRVSLRSSEPSDEAPMPVAKVKSNIDTPPRRVARQLPARQRPRL